MLLLVDDSILFLDHLCPMKNNYTDIIVIVHQFGGCGLGSVDEICFCVYWVSSQILVPEI